MSIASSLWGQDVSSIDRFSATAFDVVRVVAENIEAVVGAGYAAGTLSEVLFSRFVATSGQTVFTGPDLSGRPLQVPGATAQVYVNQRRMAQGTQYVIEANGAQIRFLAPLVAGAEVLVSNFAFAPDGSIYFDQRHSPAALIALTNAMGAAADDLDLTLAQSQATLTGLVQAATSAAETAAEDAAAAVSPAIGAAISAELVSDIARAEVAATTATTALAGINNTVVVDRGDALIWAMSGGNPVGAFDGLGRLLAVPAPQTVTATFTQMTASDAGLVLARLDGTLDRGDAGVAYTLGGVPVLGFLPTGRVDLRLSDDALDDTAARLELSPLSPDLIGDLDGWDVWRRDGLTHFTGRVWGDHPRGYVMRTNGEPWAVAPSAMRLRLAYGDHIANAAPDRAPGHFAHVATLGDGSGQDGLNGEAPVGPSTDLVRAGAGFAALSADRALADASGALRRHGVRSEAVEGATLTQLATGQPLANLGRAVADFARVNGLYGGTAGVESVTLLHSGGSATSGEYATNLVALAAAVVVETDATQVNVMSPAGTWQNGTDPAILGTVEALRTRGTIPLVLASPVHWCGIRPGSLATPDAASMTMLAELDALATATGPGWHGPIPWQATRDTQDGIFVWIDCEVMAGHALVAPSYGVRYSTSPIANMTVVPDPVTGRMTRLQVRLATGGPGVITIAYGAAGENPAVFANRCDLRDDWSAPSLTGATLRRYSHSFRAEV